MYLYSRWPKSNQLWQIKTGCRMLKEIKKKIVDKLFVETTSWFALCRHSLHEAPPVERRSECDKILPPL